MKVGSIEWRNWLKAQKEFEAMKSQADEMSYITLALLESGDFQSAAKAIYEMAKLYMEVYKRGAWNYGSYGFSKKVVQIISIAQGEHLQLNVKVELDRELQRLKEKPMMILPT